jgi:archaemetzincin
MIPPLIKSVTIITIIILGSCVNETKKTGQIKKKPSPSEKSLIIIQPIGKVNSELIKEVSSHLRKIFPYIKVNSRIEIPTNCYYIPRKRYRADSIIKWLNVGRQNEKILAVTQHDISTTKGEFKDYGVMGLGYRPGKSCVISSFRLKEKRNLYLVAVHELGHNFGLPHCSVERCIMTDAKSKDNTSQNKEFCNKCQNYLKNNGWLL